MQGDVEKYDEGVKGRGKVPIGQQQEKKQEQQEKKQERQTTDDYSPCACTYRQVGNLIVFCAELDEALELHKRVSRQLPHCSFIERISNNDVFIVCVGEG